MRSPNPDHICGLCDEFDADRADLEYAECGMGRCQVHAEGGVLAVHVAWDGRPCVSFRLDRPNLRAKREFVAVQRRAHEGVDGETATENMAG